MVHVRFRNFMIPDRGLRKHVLGRDLVLSEEAPDMCMFDPNLRGTARLWANKRIPNMGDFKALVSVH